jgi:hypothetical protein
MAAARVGDYVIANDQVRFVIRGGEHGLVLAGLGGGCLVDAGTPQADLLQELVPLAGFNSMTAVAISVLQDGSDGVAEIEVVGEPVVPSLVAEHVPNLQLSKGKMTVSYRLTPEAQALEIHTVAEESKGQDILVGDVLFSGGELEVFVSKQEGWLVSEGPEVSYGLIAGEAIDVVELGGITILLGPSLSPPVQWMRWFVVGDGSLSSVVDQAISLRMIPSGALAGTVDDPAVSVSVLGADGELVTRFRPDDEGRFSGRVPVGLYTLVATGPGRVDGPPVEVDVADGASHDDLVVVSETPGTLKVVLDAPTRLDVQGEGYSRLLPLPAGLSEVQVPPGSYTLTASRGFEYEIDQTEVTVTAEGAMDWTPVLIRSVDTDGWIASDFHLHSEWSSDSNVPVPQRVLACAAEGIEYVVATDHDMVTDYRPRIPSSLLEFIQIGVGVEVSTARFGHMNVWPLVVNNSLPGRGAPLWHGLDMVGLFDELGAGLDGRIIQINHGRDDNSAFFNEVDFDREEPDPQQVSEFRFNAMELINSGGSGFDELLQDWMVLVEQGRPIAATGVSDSHSIGAICGQARTWVQVPQDTGPSVLPQMVNGGVLNRRTLVSTGPFVTIEKAADGAGVHLRVQAPSWMPVERVTMYVDGVLDSVVEIPPYSDNVIRFDEPVALSREGGGWAVAVAEADSVPSPMLKHTVRAVSPVTNIQ